MEYIAFPWEVKESDLRPDGSFNGTASPFGGVPDEGGDIVEHGAFAKTIQEGGRNKNGIWPFLWYHSSRDVQGLIDHIAEKRTGLDIGGRYALETSRGHDSYVLAKMGVATQLSIGFDPVMVDIDEKKKIRRLKEVKLWEVSQVVFGMAGGRAEITSVKSIEEAKTERELERALRDGGLSISAAKYLVSMCRPALREAERKGMIGRIGCDNLEEVLKDLQKVRAEMEVYGSLYL